MAEQKQIKGLDMGIYVMEQQFPGEPEQWNLVGGGKGATISMSGEVMDITSKDTNGWTDGLPGFKSWESSTDGIVTLGNQAYQELENAFFNSIPVMVSFKKPSGYGYKGSALVTSLELEAAHDDVVTYSISMTGKGELLQTADAAPVV